MPNLPNVDVDGDGIPDNVEDPNFNGLVDAGETDPDVPEGGGCTVGASCDDGDACTTADVYDANCNCIGTNNGNGGTTSTASLNPIADAFVRGSNYADTNYGSSAELLTKFVGNDKYHRKSYLTFDLSAYNASDLVSATLELKVVNNTVNNTSQNLFHVQDDSWTENGITWNNQPGSASLISSFSAPVTGESVSIDITAAVISALSENNVLSLKIEGTNNQYIRYASREQASSAPELILTIGGGCDNEPCPDGDNDGICDADDNTNCNCTLNAACDDGDSCTTNDQYDTNCNCIGTSSGDSDNDGICNVNDNTNGNCTLNAACDDGDSCTTGEIYDANCNCSGGAPVGNNSTETLLPTDDTYIRGSTYANDNYGNSTTMHIKKGGNDKWTRNGYLKFNLSTVDATQLQSAIFRIKVNSNSGSNVAQELLKAPSDNWTESNLTWNNNQSGGSGISNFTAPAAGQWAEIDVTNAVQTEANGDGIISFAITSNNNKYIKYDTKESSGNEPELVLNYQGCYNKIKQLDESQINIYPNPATDVVNIDLQNILKYTENNKEIKMKIYSTNGKLIMQKIVTNNAILRMDVQGLSSNQYYLMSIEIEGSKILSNKFLKL